MSQISSPSSKKAPSPRAAVAVLAFVGIVASLMQTIVVPLIPQLPALLHTSATNTSWIITATLLAGAIVTPIAGRLGDIFGKRRMLVISLALLVVGSIICALTSSLGLMLAGLGISLLPRRVISADHQVLDASSGLPDIQGIFLALYALGGLSHAGQLLQEHLLQDRKSVV